MMRRKGGQTSGSGDNPLSALSKAVPECKDVPRMSVPRPNHHGSDSGHIDPEVPLPLDALNATSDVIAHGMLAHLASKSAVRLYEAPDRDRFMALASEVREILMKRWLDTRDHYRKTRTKRVCFLSIEFLLGRAMRNNILNLQMEPRVLQFIESWSSWMTERGRDANVEVDGFRGAV